MRQASPKLSAVTAAAQHNIPAVVALLLIVDSLHFIFAGLLKPYLPATMSTLYVLGLGTVEVGLYLLWRGQVDWHLLRKHGLVFVSIGFLVAASTNINYVSVRFIDPGIATFIAQSSIVFGLGFGMFWLRETLNRMERAGALLALLGVLIISFQPGDFLRLGALMVLASSLMYALHTAIVKRFTGQMDLASFFFFRLLMTSVFLLLMRLSQGALILPSGRAWLIVLIAGTVDVVVSRSLYYMVLRRLKLSLHTIILTLSPVVALLWSALFFDNRPGGQAILGGAVVIGGIILISIGRRA